MIFPPKIEIENDPTNTEKLPPIERVKGDRIEQWQYGLPI